jgi:hypothetical protein
MYKHFINLLAKITEKYYTGVQKNSDGTFTHTWDFSKAEDEIDLPAERLELLESKDE